MSSNYGIHSATRNEARTRIIKRSNGRCAICGMTVNVMGIRGVEWNTDHVFPRAILKWALDLPHELHKEMKSLLQSDVNQVVTHCDCNMVKNSTYDVSKLFLTTQAKQELIALREKLQPAIDSYERTVSFMMKRSDGHCEQCGRLLIDLYAIRRLDWDLPRSLDNSILLCRRCNSNYRR